MFAAFRLILSYMDKGQCMFDYRKVMLAAFAVNLSIIFFEFMSGGLGQHFVLFNKTGITFVVVMGFVFAFIGLKKVKNPWVWLFCTIEKLVYTGAGVWLLFNHYGYIMDLSGTNTFAFIFLSGFVVVDGAFMYLFGKTTFNLFLARAISRI